MADDTPVAPDASGQLPEPTPAPEQTPTPEPESQPPPPPTLTPDQIMEQAAERAFQKLASWDGRRQKDLLDNVGNIVESRLRARDTAPPPAPLLPDADPAALFSDPKALNQWAEQVVPKILHREAEKLTRAEQTFNTELFRHAGAAMDSDPLFAGESGQELGRAVIEHLKNNLGNIDKNLPPAVAATLLVHGAVADSMRKKMATKENPLAKNKPSGMPTGTIKPPAAAPTKLKPPKLSALAADFAKRNNYSEEEVAKLFGES